MCTEPGSEQTVTQVENLIVEEHDGQDTERQKHPDGMGIAVLPRLTGENRTLCLHACMCFASGIMFLMSVQQL